MVDALLITCSFAINVVEVCNIFCDIYCLQKKTKLLNRRESTSTQLFFYEKRIIYFLLTFNVYFNMWPVYAPVMLSLPLLN